MKLKTCKQCGVTKTDDSYRKYYAGRKGSYRTCLECEKINMRYKYLQRKTKPSEAEIEEIELTEQVYDMQRREGLTPPGAAESAKSDLHAILARHTVNVERRESTPLVTTDTPHELVEWLNKDLSDFTPDDLEEIWDELQDKYKPQVGFDSVKLQPIHDETYRDVLNEILGRFDRYEEQYYDS